MSKKTDIGLIKTLPFSAKEKIDEEQGKVINEYFEKIDLFMDQLISASGRKIKWEDLDRVYRKSLDQYIIDLKYKPRNARYEDFCRIVFKDIKQQNGYEVTATLDNLSQYYFDGYDIPGKKLIFVIPDEIERLVDTLDLFCRHKEEKYPKFDFKKELAAFFEK